MIMHVSAPNPRTITTGRRNALPLPSCSEPTLTPSRHHHTSRTVYRRGCSALVCFFSVFHLSKSLFIFFDLYGFSVYLDLIFSARALELAMMRSRECVMVRWSRFLAISSFT